MMKMPEYLAHSYWEHEPQPLPPIHILEGKPSVLSIMCLTCLFSLPATFLPGKPSSFWPSLSQIW